MPFLCNFTEPLTGAERGDVLVSVVWAEKIHHSHSRDVLGSRAVFLGFLYYWPVHQEGGHTSVGDSGEDDLGTNSGLWSTLDQKVC